MPCGQTTSHLNMMVIPVVLFRTNAVYGPHTRLCTAENMDDKRQYVQEKSGIRDTKTVSGYDEEILLCRTQDLMRRVCLHISPQSRPIPAPVHASHSTRPMRPFPLPGDRVGRL